MGQSNPPLPDGWVWTTIGEGAIVNPRDAHVKDLPDALTVSFVPMAAVDAEKGEITQAQVRPLGEVRRGFTAFADGDVIFAKITPCMENGKAALARGLYNGRAFGSTEFHVIRPVAGMPAEWFFYYVRQPAFREEARAAFAGTAGQLRVPAAFLEEHSIPLPPLAEQQRIVAAIEAHHTRLDAGVAALQRAQARLRRYKAAVLKAACEGRLVPQDPADEPADALLRRILAERRARWEADELVRLRARGKEPLGDTWQTRYEEPHGPDTTSLPELSPGWVWASVEQLCFVGTGATPLRSNAAYYAGGTIPWVTSGAMNAAFVDQAEELITERALAETNAKVFPAGTLLVAMYGEGKTRGKISELRIDAATNQACAALVFSHQGQTVKPFVKLAFYNIYEDIRRLSSGGVQPNLNLSIVRGTPIPLPPLAEQGRIVAEVERRLSVVDEMETALRANLARADRLRQAILRRAFAGQLVPQDPADEPAGMLLERIRAERSAASSERRAGRGSRRQSGGETETQGRLGV